MKGSIAFLIACILVLILVLGCQAKPPATPSTTTPASAPTSPTPTPPPPKPAEFVTSNLTITPNEVNSGFLVTIEVTVTNIGELPGSHEVKLKIDDTVEGTEKVTLDGGGTQKVTFTVSKFTIFQPVRYSVSIGDLSGTFVVKSPLVISNLTITPNEVNSGASVTIEVTVTNAGKLLGSYDVNLKIDGTVEGKEKVTLDGGASQKVTFTVSKFTPRTYSVSIGGLSGPLVSGTFVVKSPPALPPTTTPQTTEPTKIASGASAPPFPGNTIADLTIQKAVWLFIRSYEVADGNQSPTVVKTEITQALTADGAWAETWTIDGGGIAVNYSITFRSAYGGTIFSINKIK